VNHPVVLSANSVQTKKKPWVLLITTPPFEWRMIMAAPINPPNSMMLYPQIRWESISVPYSHTAKITTGIGILFVPSAWYMTSCVR